MKKILCDVCNKKHLENYVTDWINDENICWDCLKEKANTLFMVPNICYGKYYTITDNETYETFYIPEYDFDCQYDDKTTYSVSKNNGKKRYLCQFYAPGYLDCTDYYVFNTFNQVIDFIAEEIYQHFENESYNVSK